MRSMASLPREGRNASKQREEQRHKSPLKLEITWPGWRHGTAGRLVTRSQKEEEPRLHRALYATVRILDFIQSVMGSLGRVLTWE